MPLRMAAVGVAGYGLLHIAAVPPHPIDKYHVTAEEKAACSEDAVRFCMQAYPDEDALLGCMKANHAQLSQRCQVVFDAGVRRRKL